MASAATGTGLAAAVELRHLRAFVAVAEELSFTRAAARLHVAQSPLSRQIRQLESHLGARLLERDTHSVALTPAGRELLLDARRVLDAADASFARARRAHLGEIGTLRIGYVPSAAWGPLPEIIDALTVRLPEVRILAREVWEEEMEARLIDARLDLGLTRTPPLRGLAHAPVARERLSLLERAPSPGSVTGRPLSGSGSPAPVQLGELVSRRLLLPPRESDRGFHDFVLSLCRAAGFEPRVLQATMPARRRGGPLSTGRAVALVPEAAADDPPPGVVARPLDVPPVLGTYVLWRRTPAAPALDRALAVLADVRRRARWGCETAHALDPAG